MIKVVECANEIPPYRRPLYHRFGQRNDIEFALLLDTAVEPDRLWDAVSTIPNVSVKIVKTITIKWRKKDPTRSFYRDRFVHFPVSLLPDLLACKPDVVISNEFGFRSLMAFFFCFLFRKPLILRVGSTEISDAEISWLQKLIRRFLSGKPHCYLTYGKASERYLNSIGVPSSKIHYSIQMVDNHWWRTETAKADRKQIQTDLELRARVVLYVGRLLPFKGLDLLLQAWKALPKTVQEESTLVLVGAGPEESHLRDMVNRLELPHVILAGGFPPSELPPFYAAADLFVFPSLLDVWGLVVNEAMAVGLPVICSKLAGCAEELIVEGITGDIFDPRNTSEFACVLEKWLTSEAIAPPDTIQLHIDRWNYELAEQGYTNAIYQALGKELR